MRHSDARVLLLLLLFCCCSCRASGAPHKGIQHQGVHIGVQVRNRLWTLERHKHPEQTKWGKSMADQAKRIIDCMDLYVPPIYKVRKSACGLLLLDRWMPLTALHSMSLALCYHSRL